MDCTKRLCEEMYLNWVLEFNKSELASTAFDLPQSGALIEQQKKPNFSRNWAF